MSHEICNLLHDSLEQNAIGIWTVCLLCLLVEELQQTKKKKSEFSKCMYKLLWYDVTSRWGKKAVGELRFDVGGVEGRKAAAVQISLNGPRFEWFSSRREAIVLLRASSSGLQPSGRTCEGRDSLL